MDSIFLKYVGADDQIKFVKTIADYETRIVDTLLDSKVKLLKASPEEWDRHVNLGSSRECITTDQTNELITEILKK